MITLLLSSFYIVYFVNRLLSWFLQFRSHQKRADPDLD